MPAGAEGGTGIDEQRQLAAGCRPLDMAAAEIEAAGGDGRQGLAAFGDPVARRQPFEAGLAPGRQGGADRPAVGRALDQRLHLPELPAIDLVAREGEREGLQRRFRRFGRTGGKPQPHGPEDRRGLPHEACSAGTTKLAITFLAPALSKAMSSLSPSAATTLP